MKIGLIGYHNAGKSSIINALVGKRVASTDTNTKKANIHKEYKNLVSDDQIKYNIIDFPGINQNDTYKDDIYEQIKKCNMLFWVSDINTAFTKDDEYNAFNKIKTRVDKFALDEGISIQLNIILSKAEYFNNNDDNDDDIIFDTSIVDTQWDNMHNNQNTLMPDMMTEITDMTEITNTIIKNKNNIYNNKDNEDNEEDYDGTTDSEIESDELPSANDIKEKISDIIPDIKITLFNAHGRIYYGNKSSARLRKYIGNIIPKNVNTSFFLKEYHKNIPYTNDKTIMKYIFDKLLYEHIKWCDNYFNSPIIRQICPDNSVKKIKGVAFYCSSCDDKINMETGRCDDFDTCGGYIELRCTKHELKLIDKSGIKVNIFSVCTDDNKLANYCPSKPKRHIIPDISESTLKFEEEDGRLICDHDNYIDECKVYEKYVYDLASKIANNIIAKYDELQTEKAKLQFINFIISPYTEKMDDMDNMDNIQNMQWRNEYLFFNEIEKITNCHEFIDIIISNIRIDVKKYDMTNILCENPNSNTIMRLLTIGNNLSFDDKLKLYFHPNNQDIYTNKPIYNLDYLLTGEVFQMEQRKYTPFMRKSHPYYNKDNKTNISNISEANKKYGVEIYSRKFQHTVKDLRNRIFGDIEDDIDIAMIPCSYEKHGLFWRPTLI